MLRRFLNLVATVIACACMQLSCAQDQVELQPIDAAAASKPASLPASVPSRIAEFQGEYRFLSNFWPATVEFEEIIYPTVEHAYQAAKTLEVQERRRIAALPTASEAKRAGRALAIRDDWHQVKFEVMETCVRYKFTHHPELRAQLLSTGDAYLEEGNNWGDTVWGVSNGVGENRLGTIIMGIRTELRTDQPSEPASQPSPRSSP